MVSDGYTEIGEWCLIPIELVGVDTEIPENTFRRHSIVTPAFAVFHLFIFFLTILAVVGSSFGFVLFYIGFPQPKIRAIALGTHPY